MKKQSLKYEYMMTLNHKVAFTTNKKKFEDFVSYLDLNEKVEFIPRCGDAATHTFEHHKLGYISVVVLGSTKGKDKNQIYSLLVHESVHVFQECLEHMGEKNAGTEIEAYAIQSIASYLFWAYENERRRT